MTHLLDTSLTDWFTMWEQVFGTDPTTAASVFDAHLQGQHNQADHAGGGGSLIPGQMNIPDADVFLGEDYTDEFGDVVDEESRPGLGLLDDDAALSVRVHDGGSIVLTHDFPGPDGQFYHQPLTDVTLDDDNQMREIAQGIFEILDDDLLEREEDEDGIVAEIDVPGNLSFARHSNGDVRMSRTSDGEVMLDMGEEDAEWLAHAWENMAAVWEDEFTESGDVIMTSAVSRMPPQLQAYWLTGEGAAKVQWCTEGSFRRARRLMLQEGVPRRMVDGAVANLYRKACGRSPGRKRGDKATTAALSRKYKRDRKGRFANVDSQGVIDATNEAMGRLEALRNSLSDDERDVLDAAVESLKELRDTRTESAEAEGFGDLMEYSNGEIMFERDGDAITFFWDDENVSMTLPVGDAKQMAAAIDELDKIPVVKAPEAPPGMTFEDRKEWREGPAWQAYNNVSGSVTGDSGEWKIVKYGSGIYEIGLPDETPEPDDSDVKNLFLDDEDEAEEFANILDKLAEEPTTAAFMVESSTMDVPEALDGFMPGEHWHSVTHIEGVGTGKRVWLPGSVSWRRPPFAAHHEVLSAAHGGQPVLAYIGNVTRQERRGPEIHSWGTIDLGSDAGAEWARRLVSGYGGWPSFGPGSEAHQYDVTWGPDGPGIGEPQQIIFRAYRQGELSFVSVPAQEGTFVEASPELMAAMGAPMVAAVQVSEPERELDENGNVIVIASGGWRLTVPQLPPAEWFEQPTEFPGGYAVALSDEGRITGLLAPRDENHRTYARMGQRKTLRSLGKVDYSRWIKETVVAGGARVLAGPLVMECMHAPVKGYGTLDVRNRYYEDSCALFARVAIGEIEAGTWIAGAAYPHVTAEQVIKFLGLGVSGDWQPHPEKPGWQEFVAILAVPVEGWAKSKTGVSVSYATQGSQLVTTASTVPAMFLPAGSVPVDAAVITSLAAELGMDPESMIRAEAARIEALMGGQ